MDFWLNFILLYLGPKRPTASGLPRGKHGWPSNSQWFLVFCLSEELGTNLSCYQGTFFGTLWTWRTVLRLSTQLRHSTRKNETHIVAVSLPPPIYHAVLAFQRHFHGAKSQGRRDSCLSCLRFSLGRKLELDRYLFWCFDQFSRI